MALPAAPDRRSHPTATHRNGAPPNDITQNGLFEDLTGDDKVTFADAVVLALNLQHPAVSDYQAFFDFTGNDRVSFADAIELARIAGIQAETSD